jgi:hypothetical protein
MWYMDQLQMLLAAFKEALLSSLSTGWLYSQTLLSNLNQNPQLWYALICQQTLKVLHVPSISGDIVNSNELAMRFDCFPL